MICMSQMSFQVPFDPKKLEGWGTRDGAARWLLSERPALTTGSRDICGCHSKCFSPLFHFFLHQLSFSHLKNRMIPSMPQTLG